LATIVTDTCGRHDTFGGACRGGEQPGALWIEKRWMHSVRDTFLQALAARGQRHDEVRHPHNIIFFMNVPVTERRASFEDGGAGRALCGIAAEMVYLPDSNCPQLNNPCNAYKSNAR